MSERPGRRYEVMAQRDGRWVLDCHTATEVDALARAEELYADESVGAVRVVRAYFGGNGDSFETQIMERVREGRKGKPPLRLAGAPDENAWCETLSDFYGPSSRYAIARLLRNYLDRYQITPTELLHNHRWIKLLDNQETLLPSAIQRMAALQAEQRNLDRRACADTIDKLVDEATGKARDALASRAAPKLGDGGLPALAEAIHERVKDSAEHGFWQRYAVARAFEDMNTFAAKFERTMLWAAADPPPAMLPLIDELCGGVMGAASMIKDTLGNQPHLGAALTALADLAAGRQEPTLAGAPAGFAAFAGLMNTAAMPETRSVLYDRLQRELATDKPLSRESAIIQRRQFEMLTDKIADDSGLFAGGPAMVAALARRSRSFEIVGGVEHVRLSAAEPMARIEELLAAEKILVARRQQQGIGTYLRDAIDQLEDTAAADLIMLRTRIGDSSLPEAMKKALTARIPAPPSAA
ncbi:MAG TPA: hypothetical protein VN728_09670 [Stellaceae bacterium]|nr:hypothetical protein [Stellaceae bacterium]